MTHTPDQPDTPNDVSGVTEDEVNTAATRIALAFARAVTTTDTDNDSRIPERLPTDLDEIRTVLDGMERAAVEYADCAAGTPGENAYTTILYTRSAYDLMRTVLAYGRTITGDSRPTHILAEAVLLATLTWQLAIGEERDDLLRVGIRRALFIAGVLTGEADRRGDREDAATRYRRMIRADEQLPSSTIANPDVATRAADDEPRLSFHADPQAWRARADAANRTVLFQPAEGMASTTDPEVRHLVTLPHLTVAGVRCLAHLDGGSGRLRVSVDCEFPEHWLTVDDAVPLEILVGGEMVYTS